MCFLDDDAPCAQKGIIKEYNTGGMQRAHAKAGTVLCVRKGIKKPPSGALTLVMSGFNYRS